MINTQKAFYSNENYNEPNLNLPPQVKKQIDLIGWYICNSDEATELLKAYGGLGILQWRNEKNKLFTKILR